MRLATFAPIDTPIHTYDFVAFDTEGDGRRNGFILAAAFDETGGHIFHKQEHLAAYLFSTRNLGRRIMAANLEYDWSVAFQPFNEHHSILLNNGRWLRATYKDNHKHAWQAWDIQRIAPLSVRDMGLILGLPKLDTPPQLLGESPSTGREWKCSAHNRTYCVECYCLRDAEIVYHFARLFQGQLNELGGELKMTAASCSMNLFRRRFLTQEIAPTFPQKNTLARLAHHGGRVENFKAGTGYGVNVYDFNSLYPAVMRDLEVGLPDTYHHLNRTSRLASRLDGFGQFVGTLEIPESYIPPLPVKRNVHNYYPFGTVQGSWTFSEVRYLLEHGGRVRDLKELVFASRTVRPFRDFVDTLYSLRRDLQARGDAREHVVKILLNSLYGKFAQHSESGLQSLIIPVGAYRLGDFFNCEPVDLCGREAFLKPITPDIQSPHVHVLWSAEIAAVARLKLLGALEQASDNLYYCDTDSIHTGGVLPTSGALGGLKREEEYQRVTYFAPKEYGGVTESGRFIAKAKGVPPARALTYLNFGIVEFKRPSHILEAIASGGRVAEWRKVIKTRLAHAPVRDTPNIPDYNHTLVDTAPYPAEVLASLD